MRNLSRGSLEPRFVCRAAGTALTYVGRAEQPVQITDTTKSRLEQAKVMSKAAVVVSASLVQGAASIASSLGAAVSSAFVQSEYGKRLAEGGQTETGKAVRQVAASSLVAFGEVWDGLEQAARILGGHTAEATTHFVQEAYGSDARAAAERGLEVAGDVGVAALNMRNVSVGGIIRRTGVEAAKDLIVRTGDERERNALQLTAGAAAAPFALTNGPGSMAIANARSPSPTQRPPITTGDHALAALAASAPPPAAQAQNASNVMAMANAMIATQVISSVAGGAMNQARGIAASPVGQLAGQAASQNRPSAPPASPARSSAGGAGSVADVMRGRQLAAAEQQQQQGGAGYSGIRLRSVGRDLAT